MGKYRVDAGNPDNVEFYAMEQQAPRNIYIYIVLQIWIWLLRQVKYVGCLWFCLSSCGVLERGQLFRVQNVLLNLRDCNLNIFHLYD